MKIIKVLADKKQPSAMCASVSFIFNWPSVITVFVMLDRRPVCQPGVLGILRHCTFCGNVAHFD